MACSSATTVILLGSCGLTALNGPVPEPTPRREPAASSAAPLPSAPVTPTPRPAASPASPKKTSSVVGERSPEANPPRLPDASRNALAFAPLDDPGEVTVEGRFVSASAWSTSKVLVVAAFLDTAADGDLEAVSAANRRLIAAALTKSDADAVSAISRQIPGRPGLAMTSVLRSIGDEVTVAPDSYQGLMRWSVREQVRFMAALANGKVVSKAASAYLLATMHPIKAHAWGLGTVGATAYKGGWLRSDTATRQMGILDGYAVVIMTDGVGPAVRQTDGDSAHVQQMNQLAELLSQRLARRRSDR